MIEVLQYVGKDVKYVLGFCGVSPVCIEEISDRNTSRNDKDGKDDGAD